MRWSASTPIPPGNATASPRDIRHEPAAGEQTIEAATTARRPQAGGRQSRSGSAKLRMRSPPRRPRSPPPDATVTNCSPLTM